MCLFVRSSSWIAVLIVVPTLSKADTINLKSHSSLRGTVLGSDATTVRVQTPDGIRSVALTDVESIEFENATAPAETRKTTPVKSALTQEVSGYRITLSACTRKATESITCAYSLTNQHADRQIAVGQVYEVDSQGNLQQAQQSTLSSQRAVYNTPVTGNSVFGGVTPDVTSIAKLSLTFSSFGSSGNESFEVVFRNVPLRPVGGPGVPTTSRTRAGSRQSPETRPLLPPSPEPAAAPDQEERAGWQLPFDPTGTWQGSIGYLSNRSEPITLRLLYVFGTEISGYASIGTSIHSSLKGDFFGAVARLDEKSVSAGSQVNRMLACEKHFELSPAEQDRYEGEWLSPSCFSGSLKLQRVSRDPNAGGATPAFDSRGYPPARIFSCEAKVCGANAENRAERVSVIPRMQRVAVDLDSGRIARLTPSGLVEQISLDLHVFGAPGARTVPDLSRYGPVAVSGTKNVDGVAPISWTTTFGYETGFVGRGADGGLFFWHDPEAVEHYTPKEVDAALGPGTHLVDVTDSQPLLGSGRATVLNAGGLLEQLRASRTGRFGKDFRFLSRSAHGSIVFEKNAAEDLRYRLRGSAAPLGNVARAERGYLLSQAGVLYTYGADAPSVDPTPLLRKVIAISAAPATLGEEKRVVIGGVSADGYGLLGGGAQYFAGILPEGIWRMNAIRDAIQVAASDTSILFLHRDGTVTDLQLYGARLAPPRRIPAVEKVVNISRLTEDGSCFVADHSDRSVSLLCSGFSADRLQLPTALGAI